MQGCAHGATAPLADVTDAKIAEVLRDLLLQRGVEKSICPSEVARALTQDWRPLMPDVRRVAVALPDVDIVQKGVVLTDPVAARGPVRLRVKPQETG